MSRIVLNLTAIICLAFFVASCGKDQVVINAIDGANGINGNSGANGHSLVSQYVSPSALECPNGGNRLDIYLDVDDTLSVSSADNFQNSLIACNGANGLDGLQGEKGEAGPQGIQGEVGPQGEAGPQGEPGPVGEQGETGAQGPSGSGASIVPFTSTACTSIVGTSYFTKANGNASGIYTGSTCQSSTKVFELGMGDSFWVSNDALAVKASSTGIRVIFFN